MTASSAITPTTTPSKIPIIDLKDDETTIVQKLRTACEEYGFFFLQGFDTLPPLRPLSKSNPNEQDSATGGVVDSDLLQQVMKVSRRLFDLPIEEKMQLHDSVLSRGYTAMQAEKLDPQHQLTGDTKEGFYIGTDISIDDPRYDPSKLRGPNQWPNHTTTTPSMSQEECIHFRHVMEIYHQRMKLLGYRMVQYLALSLGLSNKDYFEDHFVRHDPIASIRLLHYAPIQSNPLEGLYACGAHTDYGMFTFLLTDDCPGLQILSKQNEWIDASPIPPNTFVVNLGDMLERYTNGMYRSTPHRVLTAGDRHRYSVPFFYEPSFDAVVECLDVCCSPDNPPKYPPTTSGQHLLDKYKQTYSGFTPADNNSAAGNKNSEDKKEE